jgi:hypothetical protein
MKRKHGMSLDQLNNLMKLVLDDFSIHSTIFGNKPLDNAAKRIKYMRPQIDMRTGEVFTIIFSGWNFPDKMFSVCNRGDEVVDLDAEIRAWLKEGIENG